MINNYIRYLVLAVLLSVLGILLPQAAFIKIISILLVTIVIKAVFFDYVDLYLVYKKARETATGAGMLFLGASIILAALINSGV